MSIQGRVGVSVPGPSEMPLDTAPRLLRKLEQKTDASPGRDAVSVTGVADATRPKGSPLTDGITLQAGASINVAHGLGRKATGFLPVISAGSASGLQNDTAQLTKDMQAKFVRVTYTGLGSVTFKLQVY